MKVCLEEGKAGLTLCDMVYSRFSIGGRPRSSLRV